MPNKVIFSESAPTNMFKSFKSPFVSLLILLISLTSFNVLASEEDGQREYDAQYHTMHHILDGYSWDFFKFPGDDEYVALHLPRILWNSESGSLDFYLSTERALNDGYISLYYINKEYLDGELEVISGQVLVPEAIDQVQTLGNKISEAVDEDERKKHREELKSVVASYKPMDFSITHNVLYLIFSMLILLAIFITIANRYKRSPYSAPKGIQSLLEPVIVFIRDDVARAFIPEKHYRKYLPLLLTFFFFIWVLNLLGLTPFAANVTGNISVTLTLALVTLVMILFSGTKDYWLHIFWMPGVPIPLRFILMIVEIIGLLAKPFALTIRLFAVITAGHVIIVSLIALIFVMSEMGQNPLGGILISPVSILFILFINLLEIFVGTLQAFVFTLLSAVFIGQALEEHEHHDHSKEEVKEAQPSTA